MRLKSKRNLTKPFTRGSTIQFVCYHGRPVGRAVMTANTGLRRTRKRQAECGVSATILPRNSNRPSNSETRDKRTQAAVRYYECQGLGHFAKECATRLKRQENIPDPRGRGSARGRSGRLPPPPPTKPLCREAGSDRESDESGKRVEGEKGGSSFHLSAPDDAGTTTPCSILLEQGTPTVSVDSRECRGA